MTLAGSLPLHHALGCALVAAFALGSSCDPVHDQTIASLGDEAPNVRTGPLHRGGQPCLVCHDGALGDPPQFSVAGTVYEAPTPAVATPAASVMVTITSVADATRTFTTTTNEAGNFYATPSQFAPSYPYTVTMQSPTAKVCMISHVGREASCAGCHVEPSGQASPGRVVLAPPKPYGVCPK